MAASTTETVELFKRLFAEVLNQRDADALLPYWAEDIVEEFPIGTFRGREAVRQCFAQVFAALPDFHIEAKNIVGEGETVFVRWHLTGTFSGAPWLGIEPTGSRVALDGIDCFTMRDGLVVHNKVVYDQLSFARQIGMLPEEGTSADRTMLAAFNLKTRLRKRFAG
jgi:steroid delta-isomerase-like uncharacterized protein